MKSKRFTSPIRRQFSTFDSVSFSYVNRAAAGHGRFVTLLAGCSLIAAGSLHANTAFVVKTGLSNGPDLLAATSYESGTLPGIDGDIVFNATNDYSAPYLVNGNPGNPGNGYFKLGNVLSIGSLNDLSTSQPITISNNNAATQAPLTLNGGNSVSGTPEDLIYVATGASLNLSNIRPNGSGGSTLNVVLGASGTSTWPAPPLSACQSMAAPDSGLPKPATAR